MLSFLIRTPSDHSSFDNSPRTIAAYHVLHRPLVPRHPPNALKHLQQHLQTHPHQQPHKKDRQPRYECRRHKQISKNEIAIFIPSTTTNHPSPSRRSSSMRCSHPLCTSQTTHTHHQPPTPAPITGTLTTSNPTAGQDNPHHCVFPQNPDSVQQPASQSPRTLTPPTTHV